jgi:hypothetical protein
MMAHPVEPAFVDLAAEFQQESIAWAVAEAEFVGPGR